MRFEEPDPGNRWDFPLLTVLPEDDLNKYHDEIWDCLIETKPKPINKANLTVLKKLTFIENLHKWRLFI